MGSLYCVCGVALIGIGILLFSFGLSQIDGDIAEPTVSALIPGNNLITIGVKSSDDIEIVKLDADGKRTVLYHGEE